MRRIVFEAGAFEDFNGWAASDSRIHRKIVQLIKDASRNPFTGIGKPEPLRHELAGYWSRRIDDEHRFVYTATDEALIIISCRYHY